LETERRNFLSGLAATAGAWAALGPGASKRRANMSSGFPAAEQSTVRDRFWIWGHGEESHNNQYVLQGTLRMTPAEGAFYPKCS